MPPTPTSTNVIRSIRSKRAQGSTVVEQARSISSGLNESRMIDKDGSRMIQRHLGRVAHPHGSSLDSDLETQLKSEVFSHTREPNPVHTIDNEIQSSPWLIKPISGVMKMDKHREGIKSNRPCGENQNCSSVKITIKTHEQNYNNNTR